MPNRSDSSHVTAWKTGTRNYILTSGSFAFLSSTEMQLDIGIPTHRLIPSNPTFEHVPELHYHTGWLRNSPFPGSLLLPSSIQKPAISLPHSRYLALHPLLDHHHLRRIPFGGERLCCRSAVAQLEDDVDDPTAVHVRSGRGGSAGRQRGGFAVRVACGCLWRPEGGGFSKV